MTTPERVTPDPVDGVIDEIRAFIGRRRWRQADLARALQVAEPWVSRRLNSKAELTVRELYRIAAALGVSPKSLLPDDVTTVQYQQHSRTFPPRRSLLPGDRPLRLSGPLRADPLRDAA